MTDFLQGYQYPLMRRGAATADQRTPVDIVFGPVPTGRIWVITNVGMEDETSNFTSLRIFIRDPGYNHWLVEDVTLLAGRLYWHDGNIWVPETRYLVCRFVGPGGSDLLRAYINGFVLRQPEEFVDGLK
jgi:hypothetical protein